MVLSFLLLPLGVLIHVGFPYFVMEPSFWIKLCVSVVDVADVVNVVRLFIDFCLILQLSERVSTFIHFHIVYRYQIVVHASLRSFFSLEHLLSFKSSCVLEFNVHSGHVSVLFYYCSHVL
jgi:hypothetical protein